MLATVFFLLLAPRLAGAWCVGGAPPALDPDGDSLNNLQEQFFGTDPNVADTNHNGIADGDEDADGDGRANKDEPTIFSIESFIDPYAPSPRKVSLVIEGTNLFSLRQNIKLFFASSRRPGAIRLNRHKKFNSQVRIYLSLRPGVVDILTGSPLYLFNPDDGLTNRLIWTGLHCDPNPGPPMLMGAAMVRINTRLDDRPYRLDYVALGGCHLMDAGADGRARAVVRFATNDVPVDAPYGGIATMPSRLIVPAHPLAKPRAIAAIWEHGVGDLVRVVTSLGESNAVSVEPPIADLRIPTEDLQDDHDQDGMVTSFELVAGTDPMIYDTDHDGLSDRWEILRGTDPLDPDANDNGIFDGLE